MFAESRGIHELGRRLDVGSAIASPMNGYREKPRNLQRRTASGVVRGQILLSDSVA